MRKNLRTLLAENDCLFGCFVQIPSPEIVEMARHFDYVIIDGEHGHISHEQMLSMIRAAEAVDLAVMVRISDIDPILINQVLDMGITSLLVPNVSSKEDAVTLVDAAYYPPLGNRGACPFTRANYYGSDTPADYYKKDQRGSLHRCHHRRRARPCGDGRHHQPGRHRLPGHRAV
ncbi:aldolase/citrate lyase family protein [Emergencia timonensis]|uniref:HpcH/HpaI aldolase family protein n=1 Tax=Emergencia timonensis TaxID=1776384 RepID=UPI00295A7A7B|nr:aldolase/citrate lyase family protein [Emergencia timonensis]WNX89498.1 aldolase/citrate lyase family protein [Emergencia timonensis]